MIRYSTPRFATKAKSVQNTDKRDERRRKSPLTCRVSSQSRKTEIKKIITNDNVKKNAPYNEDSLQPLVYYYTNLNKTFQVEIINATKPFERVVKSEREGLFMQKCYICSALCDFSGDSIHKSQKIIKQTTLHDLIYFFKSSANESLLSGENYTYMFKMFAINLFQQYPKTNPYAEVSYNLAFSHTSLVFEILNIVLASCTNKKHIEPNITDSFLKKLFETVKSPDSRERKYTVISFGYIIEGYQRKRNMIWALISNFLQNLIDCDLYRYASHAVLQILDDNYQYLSFNIKNTERFFNNNLIFFYRYAEYNTYNAVLNNLMHKILGYRSLLMSQLLVYISKHLPYTFPQKLLSLLIDISVLIETFTGSITPMAAEKFYINISHFFNQPNAQISQQSILVVMNDNSLCLLKNCRKEALTIIYTLAKEASETHWVEETRFFAKSLLTILEKLNPSLTTETFNKDDRPVTWDLLRSVDES